MGEGESQGTKKKGESEDASRNRRRLTGRRHSPDVQKRHEDAAVEPDYSEDILSRQIEIIADAGLAHWPTRSDQPSHLESIDRLM